MRINADGSVHYYLQDAMGSVIGLADASGAKIGHFEYDTFGVKRATSGSAADLPAQLGGDFRYHGQWQEASTGLYYVRARTYDPEVGRFLSRDPVEGVWWEPESYHPYTWVSNNPHVYRDPLGLFTMTSISASFGVQSGLRAVQLAVSNVLRQYALDQARGIVGDLIIDTLGTLIPSVGQYADVLTKLSNDGFAGGNALEQKVAGDILCPGLPDVFKDNLYLSNPISRKGDPSKTAVGGNCQNLKFPLGGRSPRPDLLFTETDPREIAKGAGKAWLVGEMKASLKAFKDAYGDKGRQIGQREAISNFTNRHEYAPIALLIALRTKPRSVKMPKQTIEAEFYKIIAKHFIADGTVVIVLNILD